MVPSINHRELMQNARLKQTAKLHATAVDRLASTSVRLIERTSGLVLNAKWFQIQSGS